MCSLQSRADEAPQISSRLDSTLNDYERVKSEKQDLEMRLEELEDEIKSCKKSLKESESTVESLNGKVCCGAVWEL